MHIHAATSEATIGISPATASQLYTFPDLLPRKDSAFVSRNPANTRTKPAIAISLPSTASITSLSTIGRRLYHRACERDNSPHRTLCISAGLRFLFRCGDQIASAALHLANRARSVGQLPLVRGP